MGEAEKIVPVARSTFRKYAKQGKFSTSTNARGLQIVQVAELERFFDGNLKPLPNANGNGAETHNLSEIDQNGQPETTKTEENGQPETQTQTQEVVELLKAQLADTKTELVDAKERETRLLSSLRERTRKDETADVTARRREKKEFELARLLPSTKITEKTQMTSCRIGHHICR